jgi:hypothetical protein
MARDRIGFPAIYRQDRNGRLAAMVNAKACHLRQQAIAPRSAGARPRGCRCNAVGRKVDIGHQSGCIF